MSFSGETIGRHIGLFSLKTDNGTDYIMLQVLIAFTVCKVTTRRFKRRKNTLSNVTLLF
jgi:hypothetical protein